MNYFDRVKHSANNSVADPSKLNLGDNRCSSSHSIGNQENKLFSILKNHENKENMNYSNIISQQDPNSLKNSQGYEAKEEVVAHSIDHSYNLLSKEA